jgi:3D (Asp-Asp-Asp) domain-containing protein
MKEKCKYASVSGVMALLVALGTGVKAKTSTVDVYFVRATKYYKRDINCDPWTLRGQTSTQLRLPQSDSLVTDSKKIGNVALDPHKIPEGSLVYETQTGRFFVSTTGGTAVIKRKAAISFAKQKGLPDEYQKALVFDFYFPREVVNTHFTDCWVIPHENEKSFRMLNLASQKQRLKTSFWLERLQKIYDSTNDKEEKQKLRQMIDRLQKMK